jgi:hypothetical protein
MRTIAASNSGTFILNFLSPEDAAADTSEGEEGAVVW